MSGIILWIAFHAGTIALVFRYAFRGGYDEGFHKGFYECRSRALIHLSEDHEDGLVPRTTVGVVASLEPGYRFDWSEKEERRG